MGILACYRKDCERVMSEFYSPRHGYLCSECKAEIDALVLKGEINVKFFMDSPKGKDQDVAENLDQLNEIFREL